MDVDGPRRRHEADRLLARRRPRCRVRQRLHERSGRSRLANRVQLTTDGHRAYLEAVEDAFGADVDYAQLVKLYGEAPRLRSATARPSASAAAKRRHRRPRPEAYQHELCRAPEPHDADAHAAVHAADQRLLEEVENHMHMVALYTVWYNWVRCPAVGGWSQPTKVTCRHERSGGRTGPTRERNGAARHEHLK